ncbi:hypothetical protein FALCPG4_013108 [Fusarium falciforme]
MQGQVVEDRGIKPENARWLVMCLQRFYGGWEGEGVELDGERKERAQERKEASGLVCGWRLEVQRRETDGGSRANGGGITEPYLM